MSKRSKNLKGKYLVRLIKDNKQGRIQCGCHWCPGTHGFSSPTRETYWIAHKKWGVIIVGTHGLKYVKILTTTDKRQVKRASSSISEIKIEEINVFKKAESKRIIIQIPQDSVKSCQRIHIGQRLSCHQSYHGWMS